jgi:flavorubredoxin
VRDTVNTLVIYDAKYKYTARIARAIVTTLAEFGQALSIRLCFASDISLANIDVLVLGYPAQGFELAPQMQSILGAASSHWHTRLAVTCFDVRFHSRYWRSRPVPQLEHQLDLLGISTLLPLESFFLASRRKSALLLPGEAERASGWALRIWDQYKMQEAVLPVR